MMSSAVQSFIDQAIKEQNRCLLLEFLQAVTDGLKKIEPQTAHQEEQYQPSCLRPVLERSVREKAKVYITSRGAQGKVLFAKNILEPVCGEYKTIKDCSEQDLQRIVDKLQEQDDG